MGLPIRLREVRRFFDSIDLHELEQSVMDEAQARLVIVGPVNSGKSTLFNQLKGEKLSAVSAVPGTTKDTLSEQFGPFTLVDTPGFGEVAGGQHADKANQALDEADVAVLVLDAAAGVRGFDADLYRQLRAHGIATVVVLNKMDLIKTDEKAVVADAEMKLRAPMIPISAKKGTNIAKSLIPALIDAHPRMAVTIGRALPLYRRQAARRVIRESAIMGSTIALVEPVPGLDIPLLIGVQLRMMLRLAAIYGEKISVKRARELVSAIAGSYGLRYLAQFVAKFIPLAGWLVSAVVWGTGTLTLGSVAMVFFDNRGNLSPAQLRSLYRRIRWKRKGQEQLESLNGS